MVDIDFWAARWKEGRIGFHEGRTNAFLERHVGRLLTSAGAPRRVLVPLCGKTEDLAFLAAQGHEVIGIEAVEDAVRAFFTEHGLTPTVRPRGEHVREYSAPRLTLLCGDVFACTAEIVGPVDALYDRAAVIALPPDVRRRYVAHVRSLLAPGSRGLIVSVEYDTTKMEPPPFSVMTDELHELYAGARLEQLEEGIWQPPKMKEMGMTAVERCFAVELP